MIQRPSFFDQNGIADLGRLSGASEAHILDCFQQGRYAAKCFNPAKPWTLVSECLCADVASLLGLPIPARRILPFNGKDWWGLEWRGDATPYSNGMETNLIDYGVVLGMIAFDVWMCNRDRHAGNVLFQRPSEGIPKYNLCLIDHSHALIGDLVNLDALRQCIKKGNDPQPFVRVPRNLITGINDLNQYSEWLDKIENFDSNQFDGMIKIMPSEWIPDKGQLSELVQLVKDRTQNVRTLISQNPQLFMH